MTSPSTNDGLEETVLADRGSRPSSALPDRIGRYRVVRVIGEGGMGTVYEAEQESPRRIVALKVIRPGQVTRSLLRRFELEAEVLGRLQHPGIAQIYEAGMADAGHGPQPFFAMEFIKGQSLLDYVDSHRAGVRQRLELMEKVCAAVQHAHHKGVIHRDLKPGNILVDDSGQPKVLDFGVARATDSDIQVTTIQTDVGQLVGTLPYMSPEQVAAKPEELDLRSDVYALGVILFELLSGRRPHDLSGKMIHEAARVIREDDPPALSTINKVFRGDVETIVARALEKDRSRRYQSADELAADIRRYLRDEPIVARPPSAVYQLQKFARRNKALVGGVAAVFVALVIGLIAAGWQAVRARRAEATALIQRDRAVDAERRAVESFAMAREAVDKYLTQVSDSPELKAHGLESLRTQLLGTARDFYQRFVTQHAGRAELRADLGGAHINLANISRVVGQMSQAEKSNQQAIELFDALVREQPAEKQYRRQLAVVLCNLGLLHSDIGRAKEAEGEYRRAMALEEQLAIEEPDSALGQSRLANLIDNLGILYESQRRSADAESVHKRGIQIRQGLVNRNPKVDAYKNELIRSYNNIAKLYAVTDRPKEAAPYLEMAVEMAGRLARDNPKSPEQQNGLGASMDNLAGVYILTNRLDDAEKLYQRALVVRKQLVAEHPTILEYALFLGSTYCNLGELNCRAGKAEAALPWIATAIDTLQSVLNREPRHATTRYYLSYTHSWNAKSYEKLGRWTDAAGAWEKAISLDDHADPELRIGRANALAGAGAYRRAAAQADELRKKPTAAGDALFALASVYSLCAAAIRADSSLSAAHRGEMSERQADQAVELLRRAAAAGYFKNKKAIETLSETKALDAIRDRADYKRWLSELPESSRSEPIR